MPDWRNLEETGVLPKLRKAKAAICAPGSLPKLRTALNHWLRFTATKARVGFLRPRVNEDPDAFLTESLLRQSFVADLVAGGCNVDTAHQYMSLFDSWHIGVMGYGLVASKAFEDEQFKRTSQGLRRLHPVTKIDRAAHPIELNGAVLRKSLEGVFAVYDMPGKVTSGRWQAIERALSAGRPGGFDKGLITDLVFSAATELATDGLLRPGEIMPKKGFISQSDVTFELDENGKLISATVMIVPIKRYGKDVGSTTKRPIVIKANRGGALRTAELLEIVCMVPCRPGDEATTPALRFPVAKIAGVNRRDRKSLGNLTLRKVMAWYHDKCAAAGVPHHEKVMPHSFRIGGATALFAAGVTAEEIKTMGRWSSDVYRIYCRLSKERLLRLSHRMSNSRSTQFLNGADGFLSTTTPAAEQDLEEVEQQEPRLCRLYWRLRCLLADAHKYRRNTPRGLPNLVLWHNGEIGDVIRNGLVSGAPRTVPSSSGHRNTVLVAALSRTRHVRHHSSMCRYCPIEPASLHGQFPPFVVNVRCNAHLRHPGVFGADPPLGLLSSPVKRPSPCWQGRITKRNRARPPPCARGPGAFAPTAGQGLWVLVFAGACQGTAWAGLCLIHHHHKKESRESQMQPRVFPVYFPCIPRVFVSLLFAQFAQPPHPHVNSSCGSCDSGRF